MHFTCSIAALDDWLKILLFSSLRLVSECRFQPLCFASENTTVLSLFASISPLLSYSSFLFRVVEATGSFEFFSPLARTSCRCYVSPNLTTNGHRGCKKTLAKRLHRTHRFLPFLSSQQRSFPFALFLYFPFFAHSGQMQAVLLSACLLAGQQSRNYRLPQSIPSLQTLRLSLVGMKLMPEPTIYQVSTDTTE